MATTLKSVAKLLGVSPATVSRVLNNNTKHAVSDAKREYILEGIKKYGYRPNPAARSLAMQQTLNIGLIMHTGTNIGNLINPDLFMETIMAAQPTLQLYGYGIDLAFISRDKPELSFAKLFEKRKPFDAVIFPSGIITKGIMDFVTEYNLPCAVLYDGIAYSWPANCFSRDTEADIRHGVSHLVDLNRRRIALVGWSPSGRAEQGFPKILAEHGLSAEPEHIICRDLTKDKFLSHRDHGRRAMKQLLGSSNRPDGIICASDLIAFGVLDVMNENGLTVGNEIALIGRGDLESLGFLPYGEPVLTTFRWPHQQVGTATAQVLIDQIGGKNTPLQKNLYPGEFVLRRSTCADNI